MSNIPKQTCSNWELIDMAPRGELPSRQVNLEQMLSSTAQCSKGAAATKYSESPNEDLVDY
jgi:hypothetical protein